MAMLLNAFSKCSAEQCRGLDGYVYHISDVVVVLWINHQEAVRRVTAEVAASALADFLKCIVINLVHPCCETFASLQQQWDVLDSEINDSGLHDDGTAVCIKGVDIIEITGVGVSDINI
jgi:hypothetical protein